MSDQQTQEPQEFADERAAMAICLLRELIDSFVLSNSQKSPWAQEVVPTLAWLRAYLIAQFGPEEIDGNSYEYYVAKRRRQHAKDTSGQS